MRHFTYVTQHSVNRVLAIHPKRLPSTERTGSHRVVTADHEGRNSSSNWYEKGPLPLRFYLPE